MKKYTYKIALFILLAIVTGCSKDNGAPPTEDNTSDDSDTPTLSTDIYVVGRKDGQGNYKAVYWKNGEEFVLPSDKYSEASAVHITHTGDVFIAGVEFDDSGLRRVVYWKNDEKVPLATNTVYNTFAADIEVSSTGDVYIVGHEVDENNKPTATYWKNGTKVSLPSNNTESSSAQGIYITPNNDIYIAGTDVQDPTMGSRAIYWKNDIKAILSSDISSFSTSIYVAGNEDVYVAGSERVSNEIFKAVYWKNGVKNVLPQEDKEIRASSIHVNNNKVHVVGRASELDNSNISKACYWEGDTKFNLSPNSLASTSQVLVVDNDVYITGSERSAMSTPFTAVYWKNGVKTILTDGSASAFGNGIAIVKTSN